MGHHARTDEGVLEKGHGHPADPAQPVVLGLFVLLHRLHVGRPPVVGSQLRLGQVSFPPCPAISQELGSQSVLPLSNKGNDIPPWKTLCYKVFPRRRFPDLGFPIGGARLPGQAQRGSET